MIRIEIKDRTGAARSFDLPPGERVLHAGLAAGLGLPHECATGTCGSCRARIECGMAERLWADAPGARNFRSDDDVLMCQITAPDTLSLSIRTQLQQSLNPLPRHAMGLLREVERLTPDVARFAVKLPEPMRYKAGQFVLVSLEGIAGPRAYSMTSYTPDSRELNLLVRRCDGGAASERLFDGATEPKAVQVFGPLGKAVFEPEEARPFTAIAGGSGIAGLLSILDHAAQARFFARHPSELFFGLRNPQTAYSLDDLDDAASASGGNLKVTVAFSDAGFPDELAVRHPNLSFTQGLVHEVASATMSTSPDVRPIHYVAGPPVMVDTTMRMLILNRKVSPTDIRYDKFG